MHFSEFNRALRQVWGSRLRQLRKPGGRARGFAFEVEALEPRSLMSVAILNATQAKYTDVDGDIVTVNVTGGTLALANFVTAPTGLGDQLQKIDLTIGAFANPSISFTIVQAPGGNKLANVGHINAAGKDMGSVTVLGDLGQIDAGDAATATTALNALSVRTFGRLGTDTQAIGGSLQSDILGRLGSLKVANDMKDAFISVTGGADGKIGAILIQGSLIGGTTTNAGKISASGDIGPIVIGRDLQGGLGSSSGLIQSSNGNVASVKISGSLIGGGDSNTSVSGEVYSGGNMGAVFIGRNLLGGTGGAGNSGFISSSGTLASIFIGGSLVGGLNSGAGEVFSNGNMGAVVIGHDLRGGAGFRSGFIQSLHGSIASVAIGGSIIGGSNIESGKIYSEFALGKVTIGHDIQGGSGVDSGYIFCNSNLGLAGGITIGGSVIGGSNTNSGKIASSLNMGAVKIANNLRGGTGSDSGFILSGGTLASVTIGGSIIGGNTFNTGEVQSVGNMGAVIVVRNVTGGSGFRSGVIISGSKLASVFIGGSLIGGSNGSPAGPVSNGGVFSLGDMGKVTIIHDIVGGIGCGAGVIHSNGTLGLIGGVTVGGSVIGGTACNTGSIFSIGDMGVVKIAHDLVGGSLASTELQELCKSGIVRSFARITSVAIGGSIIAGIDANSSFELVESATIRAGNNIGSVLVAGSLVGQPDTGNGASNVVISARGQLAQTATDLAIGLLVVGGRVEFANILAGYDVNLNAVNGDAQIGVVTVGGDWAASNLIAGAMNTASLNTTFGNVNDASIGAGTAIVARITSITIAGQVFGTPASVNNTDHFGFLAQQIGVLKVGGNIVTLLSGNAPNAVGQTTDMAYHLLP